MFKYRIIVAIATFRGQLDELSVVIKEDIIKEDIIKEFTRHDTWLGDIDALRLFGNCMQVFETVK